MAESCSTHERDDKCINFGSNAEAKKQHGDLGVDGRIILKCIKEIGCAGLDWILLPQYRVQWQAVGSKVVNFWIL
jgi:hypothetical protein